MFYPTRLEIRRNFPCIHMYVYALFTVEQGRQCTGMITCQLDVMITSAVVPCSMHEISKLSLSIVQSGP
jgi:hypothetical protein